MYHLTVELDIEAWWMCYIETLIHYSNFCASYAISWARVMARDTACVLPCCVFLVEGYG